MEHKTGLVLSGGGARGAYEVGVLSYVREEVGANSRFDILCGSSVGAINACYLAATSDRPQTQMGGLEDIWTGLRLGHELGYGWLRLFRLPLALFGRIPVIGSGMERIALGRSLFDISNLQRLIKTAIPWINLQPNLDKGLFDSLSVTATDILNGRGTVFVMTDREELPHWGHDPRRVALRARIHSEHALASSAIPLLFPLVGIEGRVYADGGMRQGTPVSPALRLGADKLLVIRLKTGLIEAPLKEPFRTPQPSPAFLAGKMFNALFLDQLDYELSRLEQINRILEDGEETFGLDFCERLCQTTKAHRGVAWRKVSTLVMAPSEDLGAIAADVARGKKFRNRLPFSWRVLMRYLDSGRPEEADLLSYLLFDGAYTERLLDLGYNDAKARRDEILRFFEQPGPAICSP